MADVSSQHSELVAWCDAIEESLAKIGEGDWTPQDSMLGRTGSMMRDVIEQFDAQKRRADDLEESYRALHRQWADLADERDRLRVMLDAVLPEKTTFHVMPRHLAFDDIPISPDEFPASGADGRREVETDLPAVPEPDWDEAAEQYRRDQGEPSPAKRLT